MRVAHNPTTGEYLGLNNGKWEKLRVAANKEGQKVYLGPDGWTPLDTMGASMPNNAKPTGGSSVIIDDETGAPYSDRFIIGSASSDSDKLARARALYGEDAQADTDGRIAFTNPETGRRTYVNPSGFDMGDILGGTREIASAAATLPFNMSAVGIPAGAAAGAATGQTVDALAAYMARNRAEESGNQAPEMQSPGAVAKDMAWETGLGTIGGNVFKGVGMLGKGLLNPIKESTNAAWTSLGLPSAPSLAFAGKGRGVSAVEAGVGNSFMGADAINQATELGRKTIATKIDDMGRSMANGRVLNTPQELGSFAQQSALNSRAAWNAQAEGLERNLYGQFGNEPATLTNTLQLIGDKASNLSKSVAEDRTGGLQKLIASGVSDGPDLNINSVLTLKQKVGRLLKDEKAATTMGIDMADLQQLYGALSKDIQGAVRDPRKLVELNDFNKWYEGEKTARDTMERVLFPQGRNTLPEYTGNILFSPNVSPTTLQVLEKVVDPDSFQAIRGSLVSKVGRPRSSSGIPGDEISPETLLTQIGPDDATHMPGAMAPEVRQQLFGGLMDDVRTAAGSMRDAARAGNASGTARNAAVLQGLAGGAGAAYGLAQGDPAEAAKWGGGALILPWLLSKGHTSPAVINYLSRPQGAISRAITDQVLPRIGQNGGGLMAPAGE